MPRDYPPQEPFSEIAQRYHDEVTRLGQGIAPALDALYGADPYQSLAVFPAARPSGDTLLFWHGGGWTNGYKEWLFFMAPALTAAGITFVSAGYRLAPKNVFPAGLEDASAALGWVRAKISEFGGNPNRIFLGGHSAGGHYASLLALKEPAGRVRGVLPISGVFLFGEGSGLSMRPRFLPEGSESAASPLRQIKGTPPPFFLAYGDKDFPHLMRQAEEMQSALRQAGGQVERVILEGCDHFQASYAAGAANGLWLPRALAWIRAQ